MMEAIIAQEDKELFPWLLGIANGKPCRSGDFLRSLAEAALRADSINYMRLRPALVEIRTSYPDYNDPGTDETR
jgi:hypothetical protein